jgi:hypothetical protein
MKQIIALLITCVIFIAACRSYVNHKYQLDKKFNFKSKAAFLNYIDSKKITDRFHVLYVPAENYQRFINEKLQQDSSIIYQGCYLNDSLQIKRSSTLNSNTSCMGRIDKEIENNFKMTDFPDSMLTKGNKISSYQLRFLDNDRLFEIKSEKKITLFIVYAYSLGKYYDELYKKIMRLSKQYESTIDTYLITIDPVYLLK